MYGIGGLNDNIYIYIYIDIYMCVYVYIESFIWMLKVTPYELTCK